MKFNCGPTFWERRRQRYQALKDKWIKHFCWFPTRVSEDTCVWLGYVEKKYESIQWISYEWPYLWLNEPTYREIENVSK